VLPFVAGSVRLCLWRTGCEFPIYSWNEARLAPAFALRYGLDPYPLIGGGPLSTWIYGPMGILINLPATFASSPLGALEAACLINFIILIAPLAWVFFQIEDSSRQRGTRWLALGLAILLIPRPNLVLQVADHTAIACGIMSCWFLARNAQPSSRDLCMAAATGIFAVWSKQIELFLFVGQIIFLIKTSGRILAARYACWVVGFGLLTLGLTSWYFGWKHLWLNLVEIPGRLPWIDDVSGRLAMR